MAKDISNLQNILVTGNPGLVSIVIPCCGMLDYTKLCVSSLLKHSRPPFEIIFLDIGSLDGTAEYLAGLQAGLSRRLAPIGIEYPGDRIRIEIVRTPTDQGIKEVCKKALDLTRGEYVLLLNNDTIVTPHWLEQLTALAATTMGVGLVGPMSNYASPPQLVETVPYRTSSNPRTSAVTSGAMAIIDVDAIEQFAEKVQTEFKGRFVNVDRLGGFCLLIKRVVLDKIGPKLNEWTDLGLFDSDILSVKAREADYSLAVCRDLFIHHFGTRTFAHTAPRLENPT
jgi:GT2 family glycosyltransferase